MPTAKPRYDGGGNWKYHQYTEAEWEALKKRISEKLRPFYPGKNAQSDPTFGHPADVWADCLLNEAKGAVSRMLWLRRRLTNEELRAERDDVLAILEKSAECLGKLSHDLDIILGVDADIRGCRDKIMELIPRFEAAKDGIAKLPRARKPRDAQHAAAVEMAIRVLRLLSSQGIAPAATADTDLGYTSDAVKILKIIGDEIELKLAERTWKKIIIKAKPSMPIRQ